MSKKHFTALADALRGTKPTRGMSTGCIDQWEADVDAVARVCTRFNPAFDRTRWYGYINSESGPNGGAKR